MQELRKTKPQLINELTELRQRVAELETSESRQIREGELLRIFRSSLPIGLFIIQDGKFQFVNNEFHKYTGTSSEELLGTDPMRLVHPEDKSMVRENAIKMLKGERTAPYKYRIVDRNGQILWNLEGVVSIQYQGRRAVLGHSMDITERERAEAKLEELYQKERELRQDLEREVQTRIEFTRALVHELKTPLTPVLASSELLVSELHEEPWLSIASNIQRGAFNLSKRIDELLDLAKVEIGVLKVNQRAVDALPLLRAIADEVSALISGNGQSLILDLPPALPAIWADEERMRQIVLNLLINASKFTSEGDKITLRARVKDDTLVVEVSDTGHGIPKEEQQRLFQPYHREIGDREHLSGLGLGLALCKHLVKLQGGTIWVESKVGAGSTFGFCLPLATENPSEESLEQEKISEGSTHRG
ncbi:MAG: PAS domain-containing sensor histidine kinase [Chloroflexi bacterium]|nr:PAS domain-containing sensor histidine kinase [Chloroflexota bacterium]